MSNNPQTTWSFLRNPFDAATKGSYRTMKKIGDYTLFVIQGRVTPPPALAAKGKTTAKATASLTSEVSPSEFFTNLKNILEPLVDDFTTKYKAWINMQSTRKASVSTLADKLLLLRSTQIARWDAQIQTVYDQGTPEYEALLPERRLPFQKGTQSARINAVDAFNDRIKDNADLPPALKTSVATFLESLQNDLKKNTSEKSKTTNASDDVEHARLALCQGMYKVLGELMSYYCGDTHQIAAFFDLQDIRNIQQTVFTHTVKGGAIHEVVKRGLVAEDQLKLENNGETMLHFYLAGEENMQPGTVFVSVEPETSKTVAATELGSITNHHLMVKNMDETHEGHFTATLL